MRSWTRIAGTLVAATLLATVAACGEDGTAAVDPGSGNDPVVAHQVTSDYGAHAEIEGALTLSAGCLFVGEYPVVWPVGTTWDAEARSVQLPDGQAVALGDRVRGGGGYSSWSDLQPELADPLTDCPRNEYDEIAVFNTSGPVTVTQ